MKSSLKVTVGGAVAALGLVMMLITSLIPVGTYAFPLFSGMLLIVIVIEFGCGWAFAVYSVTALLSLFLVADKEAALLYSLFFGYYPIIKCLIERIRSRIVQYLIKLPVFNAAMIATFYLATLVFSVPVESYSIMGYELPWLFLIFGNLFFVIYDLCVSKIVTVYLFKWHNIINKNSML